MHGINRRLIAKQVLGSTASREGRKQMSAPGGGAGRTNAHGIKSLSWRSCGRLMLLAAVVGAVGATTTTIPVEGRVLVDKDKPAPTTKVVLNAGNFSTLTRVDGSFTFYGVPAGTYLVEVLSPTYYFSQVKISVRPESEEQVLAVEYKWPGAPKLKVSYPLVMEAHSEYTYFERRDPWAGIRAQLMSPMTWMMLVTMGLAFVFPKMMDSMDDEQRKTFEEQFKSNNPQQMLEELMGAGKKAIDEAEQKKRQDSDQRRRER